MKTPTNEYLEQIVNTPLGKVCVRLQDDVVIAVEYLSDGARAKNTNGIAARQLCEYFDHGKAFNLPLRADGTRFQQRVWQALQNIPSGETLTYGELAKQLNSSPRAVGQACRNNPIPIIIPCHRVVSASGLGGYAGDTGGKLMAIKKWLLRHEGAI